MSEGLATVQAYLNALNAKDIEGALNFVSVDAEMATPMGLKKGTQQIKAMLELVSKMTSEPSTPAQVEDGEIVSRSQSPMGASRIFFRVENGLISKMSVKMGA